jgi:hypothetical protein
MLSAQRQGTCGKRRDLQNFLDFKWTAFLLRDAGQEVDEGLVRLPRLRGEPRHDLAEVVRREGRGLVDLARQEALAERAERHEPDAELFERRQQSAAFSAAVSGS